MDDELETLRAQVKHLRAFLVQQSGRDAVLFSLVLALAKNSRQKPAVLADFLAQLQAWDTAVAEIPDPDAFRRAFDNARTDALNALRPPAGAAPST